MNVGVAVLVIARIRLRALIAQRLPALSRLPCRVEELEALLSGVLYASRGLPGVQVRPERVRQKNSDVRSPDYGSSSSRTRKKVNSNINVTPMVDVMLVLLIIFMVITPMLQNKVHRPGHGCKIPPPCRMPTRKTPSWSLLPATVRRTSARTRSILRSSAAWCAKTRRQDRQNDLCTRRCPRPVQGGGRRH